MTNEEKAAHDELLNTIKAEIAKAKKETAEEIETQITELEAQIAELEARLAESEKADDKEEEEEEAEKNQMKSELIELSKKVKAMNETPSTKGHTTVKGAIEAAVLAKKDEFANIVATGKQTATLNLTVKSVIEMGVGNTIGDGDTQVSITQNTGIISPVRSREVRYLANVSVGAISTNRALWVEETDEQGNPVFIGEGDGKTQISVKYVEKTESVKKIAVYGKVTTEMMADLPQLISYIQNNILKRLDIATEDELFNGNGVGDSLKGIVEVATTFNAGDLAGTIVAANELDVLEAVALQVENAHGMANAIFVNPSTLAAIKLIKDEAGRPVWKDYVTINGDLAVSGMRIISTKAVTAGDFIGGDLSVVNVLFREEIGIQIGLDGNDFTNNKKTLLAEKRLVQFVSANDTPVLLKGDFITAKAALLAS
jgi:HK97 family phage major capsid protein